MRVQTILNQVCTQASSSSLFTADVAERRPDVTSNTRPPSLAPTATSAPIPAAAQQQHAAAAAVLHCSLVAHSQKLLSARASTIEAAGTHGGEPQMGTMQPLPHQHVQPRATERRTAGPRSERWMTPTLVPRERASMSGCDRARGSGSTGASSHLQAGWAGLCNRKISSAAQIASELARAHRAER